MVRRTIQSLQDTARGLFSGCLTETGACACATDIRTALPMLPTELLLVMGTQFSEQQTVEIPGTEN
jgi:hypothetical protein